MECYDILYHPDHDITRVGECEQLCMDLGSGRYQAVQLGTVCTTFSQAAKPAYRTSLHILGIPGLPAHKQQRVQKANAMVEISARIMQAADRACVYCSLENPLTSMMWQHPSILGLGDAFHFYRTDYCMWGAKWKKPTGLLTNRLYLNGLQRRCSGQHVHVVLMGALCKSANRYPTRLVEAWAALVDQHERK